VWIQLENINVINPNISEHLRAEPRGENCVNAEQAESVDGHHGCNMLIVPAAIGGSHSCEKDCKEGHNGRSAPKDGEHDEVLFPYLAIMGLEDILSLIL
jgi:hypothetical protein